MQELIKIFFINHKIIIIEQNIFVFENNLISFEINKYRGIKKTKIKKGLIRKTNVEKKIIFFL